MEFLDARRLTGPSLLFDGPGSILDVACETGEADRFAALWDKHVRAMLEQVGWGDATLTSLRLLGGISCGFTAPIDALYVASAINEWAYAACEAELGRQAPPDFAAAAAGFRAALDEESNPALTGMAAAASDAGVTLLWDDDEVSLGLGRHSQTWPVRELPEPATLDWGRYRDIPVGLVTGTNGKTTTVRLAAHILNETGHRAGLSSTDFIAVGGDVVDRDDWAGPGGARTVLRHQDVDTAILETARGGLLRRGLGIERATAAVITNIARDHLGDFGSRDLDELLQIKWIISRAVVDGGRLILNADDARLVRQASDYPGEIVWFSLDADNPVIRRHVERDGIAFVLDGLTLWFLDGRSDAAVCDAADIPITLDGAARHNTANALAAAALAVSLGVSLADARAGLQSMTPDDNPGRGNLYHVDGFTVLVDFAHNPQALQALLGLAGRLPAKRRILCVGQAGDRPDGLIRDLARNAWNTGLDRVNVSELARYYRGRGPGEVFAVIHDELQKCGATEVQIGHYDEEIDALEAALDWAQPGDLVIMLALERSAHLYDRIRSLAG